MLNRRVLDLVLITFPGTTRVVQQKSQRDVLVATDQEVNNRVYADIADEQELYDYKRKIARELMQDQANAFYKKQKSGL